MNNPSELHVIFGSGQLGQAVMRDLARQGKCVRMINRSGKTDQSLPEHAEIIAADLYDPAEVRRVSQGASVVYHTAQPPYTQWPEKFPALQHSILTGLAGSDARLVIGDNLYMYGPVDGPIHEGLPYSAKTRKGSTRARIAEEALEAHEKGRLQVVIGRASDFFGPGVTSSMVGSTVFGAYAQGKPASLLGNPDLLHTFTYIEDFGKALVVLGTNETALGQVWHVPNAETVTTRQFVHLAAGAFGVQPKMIVAGRVMVRLLGLVMPDVREMIELEYEVIQPYVVDDSKYKRAFGDHSTPLKTAVEQTADWYRRR